MPLSLRILKRPMSPLRRTWVPPHSSVDCGCTVTTRTVSPYFSPNMATAPDFFASSSFMRRVWASAFSRIQVLTRSSTCSSCSGVGTAKCE
jgi:hypothetical protein